MKKNLLIISLIALNLFQHEIVNAQWAQTNGPYGADIKALATDGINVYAGTRHDGVFHSTNPANTGWTEGNTGLTSKDITSFLINGSTVFAGTNDLGIFRSSDNGNSWTAVPTGLPGAQVTSFVLSGANIFVGYFCGGICFSGNNGASWTSANTAGLTDYYINALAAN